MRVLPANAAGAGADAYAIGYSADVTEAAKKDETRRIGLCFDCLHSQRIQSERGSTFYRCKLSDSDPTFAKYPPLPVVSCAGYIPKVETS